VECFCIHEVAPDARLEIVCGRWNHS